MRRGEEMTADLQRYERRMRAQLANVITVQTESLANIPSLDSLTAEEREEVEHMLSADDLDHGDRHVRAH